ncbi:hypothetical protein TcasGA2_TC009134 [Tribolium castaneum]|uniref:Uncharacterized protein n=1 Tax=Tribolium castaneum TaxID=7070 RepID=D6WU35_TRICA|nr:hypothetical protein TcasGA2_TC009134 [Tribolium castaneum]
MNISESGLLNKKPSTIINSKEEDIHTLNVLKNLPAAIKILRYGVKEVSCNNRKLIGLCQGSINAKSRPIYSRSKDILLPRFIDVTV